MEQIKGKSFITLLDYSKEEILHLLEVSTKLKHFKQHGVLHKELEGKNIVLLFEKDSTRTRCAFEVASYDLGMNTTYLGPTGSQMGKKESIKDTARVLGRMYDAIEYRGFKNETVETLAAYSGVPVYNGLTDLYHPTQILADMLTIKEQFGKLEGINFAYYGDARNNMGNSLMIGCAKLGLNFTGVAPKELWPSKELISTCKELAFKNNCKITFTEDPIKGAKKQDVIYTDVWVSMGEPLEVWKERIDLLHKYQVNDQIMSHASESAIFMHCLPAFHDMNTEVSKEINSQFDIVNNGQLEVTNAVFESTRSIVFDQAENRMHTIKAVLLETLKD